MNTVKKGNKLLAMIGRCLFNTNTKTKMVALNTTVRYQFFSMLVRYGHPTLKH